jgi:basic amino acid/polyamine antiporter, APA family
MWSTDGAHHGDTPVARPKSTTSDLVRALGQLDSTMIVVGILIGSGIFIVSAESARLVGATGWLLVVWVLAGLLTITGCQCGAELAAMLPRAGGQYVFLREAYGPSSAFLFGWALFLIIQTGKIAAVAVAFAAFSGVLIPWISVNRYVLEPIGLGRYAVSMSTQQLVAILVILLLTAVNTRGLQVGKQIQNSLTFVKTAALIGMIVLGLTAGWDRDGALVSSSWWDPTANGWTPQQARPGLEVTGAAAFVLLLGLAMVGPLFAQTGWANVTFTGGEVRNPGRNLPRALVGGTAIVVTLYLLANLAYAVTLPLAGIQHAPQNRVATAMMQAILGTGGALVMATVVMISTFSANNGLILAGARVYYAMARDGLLFDRAGTVNARHVPAVALVAQGLWASLLVLPRTVTTDSAGSILYGNVYTQLLEYIISAELVFYALMVGAVIVLRRARPAVDRPYRTIGYPVTPLIYISIALLLIVDLAYLAPTTSGMGFLLVLSGIPVYLVRRSGAVRLGRDAGRAATELESSGREFQ